MAYDFMKDLMDEAKIDLESAHKEASDIKKQLHFLQETMKIQVSLNSSLYISYCVNDESTYAESCTDSNKFISDTARITT